MSLESMGRGERKSLGFVETLWNRRNFFQDRQDKDFYKIDCSYSQDPKGACYGFHRHAAVTWYKLCHFTVKKYSRIYHPDPHGRWALFLSFPNTCEWPPRSQGLHAGRGFSPVELVDHYFLDDLRREGLPSWV